MSLIELFTEYKNYRHAVLVTTQFTNKECFELKSVFLGSNYSVTTLFGNRIVTECKMPFKNETAYLIFDRSNTLYETLDKIAKKYNFELAECYTNNIEDIIFGPYVLYAKIGSIVYEFFPDTEYNMIDDVLSNYSTWQIDNLKEIAKEILS